MGVRSKTRLLSAFHHWPEIRSWLRLLRRAVARSSRAWACSAPSSVRVGCCRLGAGATPAPATGLLRSSTRCVPSWLSSPGTRCTASRSLPSRDLTRTPRRRARCGPKRARWRPRPQTSCTYRWTTFVPMVNAVNADGEPCQRRFGGSSRRVGSTCCFGTSRARNLRQLQLAERGCVSRLPRPAGPIKKPNPVALPYGRPHP